MKATFLKISLIVSTLVLFFAVSAMALPFDNLVGKKVEISQGSLGTTGGGEFKIDVLGVGNTIDFISFCLEQDAYINYQNKFKITSVSDKVDGKTEDVKSETKWVFYTYMFGNSWGQEKNDTLADHVQKIIWHLEEDSQLAENTLDFYQTFIAGKSTTQYDAYVKVLNLQFPNKKNAQSQLVGAPVPEPTTLLLFGTGLLGLAGIIRRRNS